MMEINRILIANRGEIALRIMKAARDLGISTVAIYADLDGPNAYHCEMADRSFPLKGTGLADTYLDIPKIISIARMADVQAIHPGYGFLSENHLFAEACEENGLVFIGPSPELIQLMGNKIAARESVRNLGVPVMHGEEGAVKEIMDKASSLTYPLLVKAAAGGGGKGMRIVSDEKTLAEALEATSREARNYFGNGEIFLEQYLDPVRHIEFQILGDHHGNVLHVNERECSVQRRYQKIIEESPSSKGLGYTNAGTIEFLVDENQQFYFLEMNTRIQVEHPVTEIVSGLDLVREQIRIEQGIPLSLKQEEVQSRGHAIEARIYAEDPVHHFRPSPGQVVYYQEPGDPAIRMDTALKGPARIFPEYDPMISKMIAHGEDRTEALHHLLKGLRGYAILGIKTNILFLQEILQDVDFIQNRISTLYVDHRLEDLVEEIKRRLSEVDKIFYISAFLAGTLMSGKPGHLDKDRQSPWHAIGYWRQEAKLRFTMEGEEQCIEIIFINRQKLKFRYQENEYEVSGVRNDQGKLSFLLDGEPRRVSYAALATGEEVVNYQGLIIGFKRWDALPEAPAFIGTADRDEHNEHIIVSPIYGKIVKINVAQNDTVSRGDILLVIDSMKIENDILAPRKAKIKKILMKEGEQVVLNKPIIELE
jgi:3-methylcrotonyl-CoA carboxylase alpha subunit